MCRVEAGMPDSRIGATPKTKLSTGFRVHDLGFRV